MKIEGTEEVCGIRNRNEQMLSLRNVYFSVSLELWGSLYFP